MASDPPNTLKADRRLHRIAAVFAALSTLAAIFWSSSLPLWIGWRVYSEQILTAALCLSMAIVFLTRSPVRGADIRTGRISHMLAVLSILLGIYLVFRFPYLTENYFYYPVEALIVSVLTLGLLLEAIRRTIGWSLIVILGVICLYALFSNLLPGPLQSRPIKPDRLVTGLVLDSASLAGAALYIAVAVVVPFLILAQLLLVTGGSAFFSDFSVAMTGRRRGGAGKIAIVGSAFFGSVSGSAVSNVASTGAITIPLMKDGGYRPKTAAAIEASASTGGQLMPPIMGASAFLLAENLQVSYSSVMLAAIVPSVLFYLSLFFFADFEAGRLNIAPVEESRIPPIGRVLRKGWFVVVPFVVLIAGLFYYNLRPETSALYAVLVLFALGLMRTYDGGRINFGAIIEVLVRSGRAAVEVILICAIAGMIIALFARSGLSFGMGFFLVQLGKSSLLLLLVVTAFVCIILGMGLPTVGVYLLLSTLAAPPLIELGLLPMAAHLFVLYFGMLSMLTPPVAIAAFVAANMAKAPPMATGFEAVRIAWPAFLVPFLFAASPELLLYGSPLDDVLVISTAIVGVYLITAAIVGFLNRALTVPERLMSAACGAAALLPQGLFEGALIVSFIGVAGGVVLWVVNRRGLATA